MVYRVHLYDDADGSAGYAYFGSRRAAYARLIEWRNEAPGSRMTADIKAEPTPASKAGWLDLMERWGGHPDNG